jgi:hypothetical protein
MQKDYPLKPGGVDDYPIKIGTALFTMVDPHKGFENAYNRWYERDHFYAGCMIGPGQFAGKRWVATRELKDLRFPADSPFARPLDAGSYLATYWHLKEWSKEDQAWGGTQVWWLYNNGRGFAERSHAHTGHYTYESSVYDEPDPVPVELALDAGYQGLGVVVIEPAEGTSHDELRTWIEANAAPKLLGEGVKCISSWSAVSMQRPAGQESPMSLGTDGGAPDRVLQMCFLDTDPREVWDRFHAYADAIDAGGKGKVSFAAPFFATKPGTDTYVDQLW